MYYVIPGVQIYLYYELSADRKSLLSKNFSHSVFSLALLGGVFLYVGFSHNLLNLNFCSFPVKKSVIGQDLQAYAHGCWGLFPAFCHWPSDTYQSFSSLTDLLIPVLKKDSFIIENIAIGLQVFV